MRTKTTTIIYNQHSTSISTATLAADSVTREAGVVTHTRAVMIQYPPSFITSLGYFVVVSAMFGPGIWLWRDKIANARRHFCLFALALAVGLNHFLR